VDGGRTPNTQIDCMTMLPGGRQLNEVQTNVPCPMAVTIGQNYLEGVKYTPGKVIQVGFKVTTDGVSRVFCRASQVLMDIPLGRWIAKSPSLVPYACRSADDALQLNYTKPLSAGTILAASWTPPSTPGYGNMEIVCTVGDDRNDFWMFNTFMLVEETN
jgi:hypothetical protein